jgi:hypothetical protein
MCEAAHVLDRANVKSQRMRHQRRNDKRLHEACVFILLPSSPCMATIKCRKLLREKFFTFTLPARRKYWRMQRFKRSL